MTPDSGADVVARARALTDAGRSWQARDLLAAHVETRRDVEALTMLGHVHHGMGDLPRAGAAWFAAGVRGPEADEAVAAWRERSRDDFGVMWRSLPPPFQAEPRPARIEALRARALDAGAEPEDPSAGTAGGDGTTGGSSGSTGAVGAGRRAEEVDHPHDGGLHDGGPPDDGRARGDTTNGDDDGRTRGVGRARGEGRGDRRSDDGGSSPGRGRDRSAGEGGGAEARGGEPGGIDPDGTDSEGVDAAQVVAWIVAAVFVFCAVVGFVTVLGWMVPS